LKVLINTLLLLAGVIPGHIHAFYLSCTYFHRKSKIRKGRYPGGPKHGIYSPQIWNGGASDRRVHELWLREQSGEGRGNSGRSGKGKKAERKRVATRTLKEQVSVYRSNS
jgi:hypothetical protein